MIMKPRTFDGRSVWEDYFSHFESLGEINEWTQADKRKILRVSLVDMAQQFIDGLDGSLEMTYPELVHELAERFGTAKDAALHRATLRARQRRKEEDLPTLGQDIRRLIRLAYPGGGPNNRIMEVEAFVSAVTSKKLKEAIYSQDPTNLEDAIKVGVRMESFYVTENTHKEYLRNVSNEEQSERVGGDEETLFRLRHPIGCPKDMCYGCWETGHHRRNCPTHPYSVAAKPMPDIYQLPPEQGRWTNYPARNRTPNEQGNWGNSQPTPVL